MDPPVDPAPTSAAPLRVRRESDEWWVSAADLTTALTLLEFEVQRHRDKAMYAPAFATVRVLVEQVIP